MLKFKFLPKTLLLLGGLLMWAVYTRPLVSNFTTAIQYSDRQSQASVSESMVPGDHIQLLYHFWLCRDMISGGTPAFSNIYEFNTGDDASRFKFDPFYIPFSLVYAAVSPFFGNAAGWNAAGLFSVLLGIFGIYALVRRYGASQWLAVVISLVATAHPYRWVTLAGGSPTGFASGLVPWVLYGLDGVVRDKSARYGLLAGAALFFSYCSDLHVFYFASLLSPFWCVAAFLASQKKFRLSEIPFRKLALAFLPFVVLAAAAVALSSSTGGNFANSTMEGGRTMKELNLFSPVKKALFLWTHLEGISNHIFYGNGALLFVVFAFGFYFLGRKRYAAAAEGVAPVEEKARVENVVALIVLLSLAVCVIILLSFGAKGPLDGLPVRIARRLVPKYKMIRQPMKILAILAPILSVLYALLLAPLFRKAAASAGKGTALLRGVVLLIAAVAVTEIAVWFSPALCRLPAKFPAYSAAADDAAAKGIEKPGALAVPMWPGDSHWSSVYEYGIIFSRLRLVNGYSPAVPADYYEGVFSQLSSVNYGILSKEQIDIMLSRGIRYVIFHEQPYPAKVSPFPASVALRYLRANPYLELVASENGVWAFAVREEPRTVTEAVEEKEEVMARFPASYHWSTAKLTDSRGIPGLSAEYRTRLRAPVPEYPGMRYMILASGGGRLVSDSGNELVVPVEKGWISFPLVSPLGENLKVCEGEPRLSHILITAGAAQVERKTLWKGGELLHTGFTDKETGYLVLPETHSAGLVLYGPCLPFARGSYRVELECEIAGSAEGVVYGELLAMGARAEITGSGKVSVEFTHDGFEPVRFEVHSRGGARMVIKTLSIEKSE